MSVASCDSFVCCMGCLSLVPGLKRRIVRRIAFFPPQPPGYWVESSHRKVFLWDGTYKPIPSVDHTGNATISIGVMEIKTAQDNTVWSFYFTRPDANKTLLFSHGNSTDIGLMFNHLLDLCRILKINVLAYDYSGYGCSTGEPSETSLYKDIDAVFRYLVETDDVEPKNIILYGQSVGSAPTLDLASRVSVGGVILHSGIKSGLSVLKEDLVTTHWFDAFKNVEKIKQVICPVFVMHGICDKEVKVEHGMALHKAAPNALPPWWIEGAGHNDIEIYWRSQYFKRIEDYISTLSSSPSLYRPSASELSFMQSTPLTGKSSGSGCCSLWGYSFSRFPRYFAKSRRSQGNGPLLAPTQ